MCAIVTLCLLLQLSATRPEQQYYKTNVIFLDDEMSAVKATVDDFMLPESGGGKSRPKLTKTGKILLGITGASFVGVCAATVPFLLPAARRICLPFVPATNAQVSNVMALLKSSPPGRLVDLGSGDGRIVIEAARRGFQVLV